MSAPKILIVDDSAMIRITVRKTLESVEFDVSDAKDGKEGLEKAISAEKPFDLILTDLNMPIMNGLEMIEELRKTEEYSETPIVMLTTESGQDAMEVGQKHGVSSWLVKPFQPDELIESVGGMLF